MGTVEVELRKYRKHKIQEVDGKKVKVFLKDAPMPLVLRVTAGGVVSRKNSGMYIRESQWDPLKRRVNRKHSEAARLNDALDALVKEAEGLTADSISQREAVIPARIVEGVFSSKDFYELAIEKMPQVRGKSYYTAKNYAGMIPFLKSSPLPWRLTPLRRHSLSGSERTCSHHMKSPMVRSLKPGSIIRLLDIWQSLGLYAT